MLNENTNTYRLIRYFIMENQYESQNSQNIPDVPELVFRAVEDIWTVAWKEARKEVDVRFFLL